MVHKSGLLAKAMTRNTGKTKNSLDWLKSYCELTLRYWCFPPFAWRFSVCRRRNSTFRRFPRSNTNSLSKFVVNNTIPSVVQRSRDFLPRDCALRQCLRLIIIRSNRPCQDTRFSGCDWNDLWSNLYTELPSKWSIKRFSSHYNWLLDETEP